MSGVATPDTPIERRHVFRWTRRLPTASLICRPRASRTSNVIQIVPFASQHGDGVGALIVGIQRDEFQMPITLEDQPDLQDIPAFYQQGAGNFWVALSEGTVV